MDLELPKPIRFLSKSYIAFSIWIVFWLSLAIYRKDISSICIMTFFAFFTSVVQFIFYKQRYKYYKQLSDLYSIKTIFSNVVFTQQENSIVFNFVFPSERILGEIKKLIEEEFPYDIPRN